MTVDVLERMSPLFREAREAFLNDPAYAFELARQGSLVTARREKKSAATLGSDDCEDV